MIQGDIHPDELGPGTDNVARVETIRERVRSQHDDGTPFVLLPVRIETRFMQVDRPARDEDEAPSAEDMLEQLRRLHALLDEIAVRDFHTELGTAKRKVIKRREREHYQFIEAKVSSLKESRLEMLECLRNCSGSSREEASALRTEAEALEHKLSEAEASVAALRSDYQRRLQGAALHEVRKRVLRPIRQQVDDIAAPKLDLMGELQYVPAPELTRSMGEIHAQVEAKNRRGLSSYAQLEEARDELYPRLRQLRSDAHRVVRGSETELEAMHDAWRRLDSVLDTFTETVAAVPVMDPYEKAGRTRTQTHINEEYRLDLQALGGGPVHRFQRLTNKDFAASARAMVTVTDQLRALLEHLSQSPAPPGRRGRQTMEVVGDGVARIGRIQAASRDISILPSDRFRELTALHREIETRWQGWMQALTGLAEREGRDATEAQRIRRDAIAAAARLERAIHSQRIDVWDAYDRFYDDFRRKVFATTDVRSRTVDELWVRIYPDDLFVYTHEAALTESERTDGENFWLATLAANGNEGERRAAWRALARLHGSQRAAWITRVLRPESMPADERAAEAIRLAEVLRRRVEEVARSTRRLLRSPERRIRDLDKAVSAAERAVKRVERITTSQQERLDSLLRVALEGIRTLRLRLRKRLPFVGVGDISELDARLESLLDTIQSLRGAVSGLERIGLSNLETLRSLVEFPEVETKDGAWTVAPHCPTLPDRFVCLAVADGRVVHAVAGETVEDIRVGLDPDPSTTSHEQFGLDENGDLTVGESIRWMVDFDEAVAKGMAIRMPITPTEAEEGFDELLVVGIKETTAEEGQALVESLLDNHHYAHGLGFLPIGTATNNTEGDASGYQGEDDPDASYDIERGDPLFDAGSTDPLEAADGLRFAHALGIDPDILAHVEHAGRRDATEARIMNEALWPATIGAYAEDFLGTLLPVDHIERLHRLFVEHVSARGMQPAFRVDEQPYGVLTTMAHSRYVPPTGPLLPSIPEAGVDAMSPENRERRFETLLGELLDRVRRDWSDIRRRKVKHIHGPVDDPQQHFMDILGLHATSVDTEYRFALNVASRHPAPTGDDSGLRFGYSAEGPVGFLVHFDEFLRKAFQLPGGSLIDAETGQLREEFKPLYDRITDERAYDVRYLERPKSMRGPRVGGDVADYIARLLDAPASVLVDDARHDRGSSRAVLYLLLRQALLNALRFAALGILGKENILSPEERRQAGSSDRFMVRSLKLDLYLTKWSYLFGSLQDLDGRADTDFPKGPSTLYTHLTTGGDRTLADYLADRGANSLFDGFPGNTRHAELRHALQAHADRVGRLATIPKERLEALLLEHLDLCSYRIDAWQLGLAQRRLSSMRESAPRGCYLGAYGWVEDLRPGGARRLAEDLPPLLHRDGEPVFADEDNQGFVHTPSINHAVTAAVLRSAYLTNADDPDADNEMAVNLTSRRVRLALSLLDGVESGQDLGALLGYRFERQLHESYARTGVELDAVIYAIRRAYPATGTVDEAATAEIPARRMVTDGQTMLESVQDWVELHTTESDRRGRTLHEVLVDAVALHGTATLPLPVAATEPAKRPEVFRALDALADALDALGDVALSESVFQIVRGNFPRAAAVLSALASGKRMPRPQVIDTPRSGTTVTHRVILPLPRFDGADLSSALVGDPGTLAANRVAALPPGWTDVPMTPRANAEPGLNHWIGSLLGDAESIVCRYVDTDAEELGPQELSARDLGLQPIDLLHILGDGLEEAERELAARITHHVVAGTGGLTVPSGEGAPLRGTIEVRLVERGNSWPIERRTFAEIEPLLSDLRTLLGEARAASRQDLVFDEGASAPSGSVSPDWDAAELRTRVEETLARLHVLGNELMTALNGGTAPAEAIDDVEPRAWAEARASLFDDPAIVGQAHVFASLALRAADFGVRHAWPATRFESVKQVARRMRASTVNAFVQVAKRLQEATALVTDDGTLLDAARAALGKGFVTAPHFTVPDGAGIEAQLASGELLRAAEPFAVDGWLAGLAAVRPNLGALQRATGLAEAFGRATPEVRPAQLPHVEGDFWLGLPHPADYEPSSDKLSFAVVGPDTWAPSAGPVAALLLDQWNETIPSESETTGTAFHYDQPDATPPQAVMVVVPPEVTGRWEWDDLVHTLHDTLELARNRTVELEHLGDEVYAQLLPAVLGEVVPDRLASSEQEVTGSRVILDFGVNNYT